MNQELLHQINKTVGEDDELYIMGDFAWKRPHTWFHKINCKTIHLTYGNHDNILSMESLPFASQDHYKEIMVDGQKIVMFHYAMRVWNGSHRGSFLLYGHSHNSIDNTWGKSMDVGVDAAKELLGEYRPFSLSEITEILSQREVQVLDHHNSKTKKVKL
jgi:calcineurin-like phosphoesterase family protein